MFFLLLIKQFIGVHSCPFVVRRSPFRITPQWASGKLVLRQPLVLFILLILSIHVSILIADILRRSTNEVTLTRHHQEVFHEMVEISADVPCPAALRGTRTG